VEKLIRDGKVAVLVGCTRGDIYATHHDLEPTVCFTPRVALAVLKESTESLQEALRACHSGVFHNELNLYVDWIDVGREFYIHEEESMETIRYKDSIPWLTA